jgi:hypothetical protein
MMFAEFWDIVLNPIFVITFGLVMAAFVPLLLSIYVTWKENGDQMDE